MRNKHEQERLLETAVATLENALKSLANHGPRHPYDIGAMLEVDLCKSEASSILSAHAAKNPLLRPYSSAIFFTQGVNNAIESLNVEFKNEKGLAELIRVLKDMDKAVGDIYRATEKPLELDIGSEELDALLASLKKPSISQVSIFKQNDTQSKCNTLSQEQIEKIRTRIQSLEDGIKSAKEERFTELKSEYVQLLNTFMQFTETMEPDRAFEEIKTILDSQFPRINENSEIYQFLTDIAQENKSSSSKLT